jgi:hypothetical protein
VVVVDGGGKGSSGSVLVLAVVVQLVQQVAHKDKTLHLAQLLLLVAV